MVELVIVIILIGILGTVAASRFFERTSFDTVAWTEQVKATLRYAQKVAIAQNQSVFVHMTQDRVSVCLADDAACPAPDARVRAPGGANSASSATRAACNADEWMCEGRPAGVTMGRPGNATQAAGGVAFDGLGRARMLNGFGGRLEIKGKGEDKGLVTTIAIEAETGYVD